MQSERVVAPLAIIAAATAMWLWTGRFGPDVLIDFGRELYLAWQLADGAVLYRDIAHLNGPFSPYLNALWFQIFGVGLETLVWCNLAIAAGITFLLYRQLRALAHWTAAGVACGIFVVVFGFAQIDGLGNFDYLTPYSHGMTHGLVLVLLALAAFGQRGRLGHRALALSGFCLGLAFLTKPEIFFAGLIALGTGLAAIFASEPDRGRALRAVAWFTLAAALPVAIAGALLSLAMPAGLAFGSLFDPYVFATNAEARDLRFYRAGLGTLDIAESLASITAWTLCYAAVFIPAGWLALRLRAPGRRRVWIAGAAFAATAGGLAALDREIWPQLARPLPIFAGIGLAWAVAVLFRARSGSAERDVFVARIVWLGFALACSAKMILNARLVSYGFVLAMPAVMLATLALLDWIPRWIAKRGGFAPLFQAVALAAMLAATAALLQTSDRHLRTRTHPVATSPDALWADGRGAYVQLGLEEIQRRLGPDDTLVVLPEGAMLNYLTRQVNPTPYLNYLPLELVLFGEDRILASLIRDPPDYVALVHRDTSGYGVRYFGRDYGRDLYAWVLRHYRAVRQIGAPPLQPGTRFGMSLLARRDALPESVESDRVLEGAGLR